MAPTRLFLCWFGRAAGGGEERAQQFDRRTWHNARRGRRRRRRRRAGHSALNPRIQTSTPSSSSSTCRPPCGGGITLRYGLNTDIHGLQGTTVRRGGGDPRLCESCDVGWHAGGAAFCRSGYPAECTTFEAESVIFFGRHPTRCQAGQARMQSPAPGDFVLMDNINNNNHCMYSRQLASLKQGDRIV